MKAGRSCWLVLALSLSGIGTSTGAWAQGDGYVTNSNARGVIPFGSYHVGGIDNVGLSTGTA